jgi:1,3-beta-glucan synthase
MIAATVAEFSHIATTWNNTTHLARSLIFLLITLALATGPTFYVAIAESQKRNQTVPLILGIVQSFTSVVAILTFAVIPSGRMFGDRVVGKSRKHLASQTFTASYPLNSGCPPFSSGSSSSVASSPNLITPSENPLMSWSA